MGAKKQTPLAPLENPWWPVSVSTDDENKDLPLRTAVYRLFFANERFLWNLVLQELSNIPVCFAAIRQLPVTRACILGASKRKGSKSI